MVKIMVKNKRKPLINKGFRLFLHRTKSSTQYKQKTIKKTIVYAGGICDEVKGKNKRLPTSC